MLNIIADFLIKLNYNTKQFKQYYKQTIIYLFEKTDLQNILREST